MRDVAEPIEQPPGSLRRHHPSQRHFLLEEDAIAPERIDTDNTVGSIIHLETSRLPEDIRRAVSSLDERLRRPEYASLKRAVVVWINRIVLRRLMPNHTIPEVNELQEIDTMLAERVEEWTEQWKREGLMQGMQEGLQQGMQLGRLAGESTLLQRQFTRRFGPITPEFLARLQNATLEQIEQGAENILDASTIEDVFKDH